MIDQQTKYLVAPLTGEILDDALDLSGYGFELTATGLLPTMEPTFKQWQSCGLALRDEWRHVSRRATQIQFAIGDWLVYGENHYQDEVWNTLDPNDYAYETVRNFMSTARSVAPSRRRDDLPYSHHVVIAPLPPETQTLWLDIAQKEHLSVGALTERVKASKGIAPRDHSITCPQCGATWTP